MDIQNEQITDLNQIIEELKSVSDADLHSELIKYNLVISEEKFHQAFSSYGLTNFLSGLPLNVLRSNTNVPDAEMNGIRWTGVVMLRGYITMVYMRSNHLENGLNNVDENSPIFPFKKYFGRNIGNGQDSIARHIRNSFSHGSFELSNDMRTITFNDGNWGITVQTGQFIDDFCEQVFRFYSAAFQLKQSVNN